MVEYKSPEDKLVVSQWSELPIESAYLSDETPIYCFASFMSYGTPRQFFASTTSISEYGLVHHSQDKSTCDDYLG
jgi:hypothetical protein